MKFKSFLTSLCTSNILNFTINTVSKTPYNIYRNKNNKTFNIVNKLFNDLLYIQGNIKFVFIR